MDNQHDVKQINRETDSWIELLDIQFIRTILDVNFLRTSFIKDITQCLKNEIYRVIKPSVSAPQLNILTNLKCKESTCQNGYDDPVITYDARYGNNNETLLL